MVPCIAGPFLLCFLKVNYVGKGGRLYQPGDAISGSASVVARALRTGYLWDTVHDTT